METKKKYVQVGVGGRARFFYIPIARDYSETCEIKGFCDVNKGRMDFAQKTLTEKFGYGEVKQYGIDEFEKMIEEQKPDCVIVTSIDRTHHKYIVKALEMGCDVITEKPMTIDEVKCQEIIDAVKRTGKNVRVSFNYRYSPHRSQVKKLLMSGIIGEVKQVHFEWYLDTFHGADYFRRWHRDKRNSGGLLVHKATHHFDLVNFWLGTKPKTVFAFGDLMFYGRENAENRGITDFYYRTYGSEQANNDPFAFQMKDMGLVEDLYLNAEKYDGYLRDQSVFSDGISIEDVMNVLVKYENGVQLSYSLNAFSPKEGYKVSFTGTEGRLEVEVNEVSYVNAAGDIAKEGASAYEKIVVYPMFKAPYEVEVEKGEGGHGGGDPILLNDLFGNPKPDPLKRAASYVDGAMSILTGVAANKSIATGLPVNIKDLVQF